MSGDYLMRQIEDMTRFFASVVFGRRLETQGLVQEDGSISQSGMLWHRIKELLAQKRVNEAENLLFEILEADPRDEFLPVVIDFYREVQSFSDDELAACGFERAEIAQGLREVGRIYEIDLEAADGGGGG